MGIGSHSGFQIGEWNMNNSKVIMGVLISLAIASLALFGMIIFSGLSVYNIHIINKPIIGYMYMGLAITCVFAQFINGIFLEYWFND
jgi:hypothetical protein